MSNIIRDNLRRHLVDLGAFFESPRCFLEKLQGNRFEYLGYDCSTQVAIRLVRWSRAIDLTPIQTHVMNQILDAAIRKGSVVVKHRIRSTSWFIPSSGDLDDLSWSVASKALEHLTETHNFSGQNGGPVIPNPSILAFVAANTRFLSREAMEHFVYHKRCTAEEDRGSNDSAPSGFLLETYIRQQKSLLKHKTGKERVAAENKIRELTARLYGMRSEIRLSLLEEEGEDQDRSQHLSSADLMDLAYYDDYEVDRPVFTDQEQSFLDYLFQIGEKEMSARDLIPALIEAHEFRAIHALLRVLKDPGLEEQAQILSDLMGHRPLSDIRKQILRPRKTDSVQILQLLSACKRYVSDEIAEQEIEHYAMACGA
ncbi:hypothetical protein [Acidithiobacillus acidisediminis]|jgi:hypothetical protein|uniref:hypothetical protein n=1 Tax=Acidithiobacillus acidisediminis TaxID=2937799 RepID=UPI00200FD053|nr:hypothetical protein [Acidithiobacillus sp. S30A2]